MKSPIRYYGGKGGMYKNILFHFPPFIYSDKKCCNNGDLPIYIEAYGGSASLLFHKEKTPIEIYNDLEINVYNLFNVLSKKESYEKFKELCDLSIYSRKLFDEYIISLRIDELNEIERAFRFYYVNRVAYNGVGGFSCIVNAVRRNMSKSISDMLSSIDCLDKIHQRLSSVIIENKNAIELIRKYDQKNVFFYLDPPYHHSKRTSARYDLDMNDEQQYELIETLISLKNAKVLISGYSCELYNKLEDNQWERIDLTINTQTSKRVPKKKIESLWKNY